MIIGSYFFYLKNLYIIWNHWGIILIDMTSTLLDYRIQNHEDTQSELVRTHIIMLLL